jgi:hypothetical protein
VSTPVIFTRPPKRSPASLRRPEKGPREPRWLVTVILLSLLAHLLFVLALVLANRFMPPPKLKDQPAQLSTTTLSLEPPPPAPQPSTPPKHIFMPTEAQPNALHKNTLIESANDNRVQSESHTARDTTSVMPDIDSKIKHPANLKDSPNSPSKEPPHAAQNASKSQPQKTQPSKSQSQQSVENPQQSSTPAPPQANPQPTKSQPTKTPAPKPAPPQQYDPNGLPVLPALNAPTMAPANPEHQDSSPAVSVPSVAQDSHGALGTHGAASPEAMATELGKYKQRVYAAIGSYWYPKVDEHFQVLPVGVVHIQFTIHQDGTVSDVKVLEGDSGELQLLLTISQDAIVKQAPYPPFTPGMIQQVGESYTDDVSFSIYGQ